MIRVPEMLMVGASCKANGKTTFICTLIERFRSRADVVGIKISTIDSVNESHHPDVTGAGKNKLSACPYCITEEKESSGYTDTAQMLRAGAKKVLWLQAMNTHLKDGIGELVGLLGENVVSVCESNRARREIEPGVFVMIGSSQEAAWKPSAREVAEYADRIIVSEGGEFDIDLNDIQLLGGRWTIRTPATAIISAGPSSARQTNTMPLFRDSVPESASPFLQSARKTHSRLPSRQFDNVNTMGEYQKVIKENSDADA